MKKDTFLEKNPSVVVEECPKLKGPENKYKIKYVLDKGLKASLLVCWYSRELAVIRIRLPEEGGRIGQW